MSVWRDKARVVIDKALREGRAAGLEGADLVRFVDARYPWGARENHPYKIWLNERALQVFGVKRPMGRPKAKVPAVVEGQGELFGGESS